MTTIDTTSKSAATRASTPAEPITLGWDDAMLVFTGLQHSIWAWDA